MNETKKNLWKYSLYTFFVSLAFSRAIFMLFLKDLGFTTAQMGLLESILFVATFVMEIPTGILGDRIGRKWSMACGIIFDLASSLIFLYLHSFSWMILAFILTGTSFAFFSGSDRALYFDSLKALGRESEYLKRKSRLNALSIATFGVAMIAGGWLRRFGWSAVYWASIFAALLNLVVVLSLQEERLGRGHELSNAERLVQKDSMREALNYFVKDRRSRLLVLFMVGIGLYGAFDTPFAIYNQLLLDFHGLSAAGIALVTGISTFLAAAFTWVAGSYLEKKDPHRVLIAIMIVSSVLLLFELTGIPWVAVAIFLVMVSFSEGVYLISDSISQEGIPSAIRASLLSAFSFFENFFVALVYFFWGILLERVNPSIGITSLGIFMVIALVIIWRHGRLKKLAD